MASASGESKVYGFEEVAQHNAIKDCWLIIHGELALKNCGLGTFGDQVYDVTSFMEDHPGGDEVLLAATGKDATTDFEDVGHSDEARETMRKYCIGEIDPSSVPAKRANVTPPPPRYQQDNSSDTLIKILQFAVPAAILGLAFAVRYFTKSE